MTQENSKFETGAEPSVGMSSEDLTMASVYRLRNNLRFQARFENGKRFVLIEDPVRGKFFRVGVEEYRFIALVDGELTNEQVMKRVNDLIRSEALEDKDSESSPLDRETASGVCQWLMRSNLVTCGEVDGAKRLNLQAEHLRKMQTIALLNPISFKISLFNPNRLLQRFQSSCQWLFSVWFLALWVITGLYSISVLAENWDRAYASSVGVFSADSWLWLLITWFVLKVIHEAAHGIACRRYGGEVPEAGVLLLLFTPMAYVNVTSMWRFSNRWHRMVVSAAGMYVELFVAFIAIIVWAKSSGLVASTAYSVVIMASVTTILFNANPLMRFDGYFLLSDWLAIPNLYGKGTSWFGDLVKWALFGVRFENQSSDDEKLAVMIYGTMAFFWKISISVGLIIAASVLFQGAGLVMSAVGVVLWFGLPLIKQIEMLCGKSATKPLNKTHSAVSAALLAGLLLLGFNFFRAPATKSAPALVRFCGESTVRSLADGFVKEIFVTEGQTVSAGEALLVLENPALTNQLLELERLLGESKIQTRIFQQQGDHASAQAESQKSDQIAAQIFEKRSETEQLIVKSPADGVIVQRNLANQVGSFAVRGDELLTVARLARKEVVVSVDQRDYDASEWKPGKSIRLIFPGRRLVTAKLVSVDPRASVEPKYPSLSAVAGGSLPVKAVSESRGQNGSGLELLSPRFDAVVEIPSEAIASIPAGRRGKAFFSVADQSFGSYLYLGACHWLESSVEAATLQ
jgi:putative peptide zinc metalloprotease protein